MNGLTEHYLRTSIARQERLLRSSLVLNPVENIPFAADLEVASSALTGLYNSDKLRTRSQRRDTTIQFAGRRRLERDSRLIYRQWAVALEAHDATFRLLSGLHAHIAIFMAIAQPGQRVLLLPTRAGGHMSGAAILERLGLETVEMVVDDAGQCVNAEATMGRAQQARPQFVFVDRSEGLVVEDFGYLSDLQDTTRIFDASQYISNIIAGDHPNPFRSGFELLLATVHKNFPGPQKALAATSRPSGTWDRLLGGLSTFVSNMHSTSTYAAGLALSRRDWLTDYSKRMLALAVTLEAELAAKGVPMVRRPAGLIPTHHLWIMENSRTKAFETFEALERCRILTNFRQLPYGLGFGVRLGMNAAARLGLEESDLPELAELIAAIRQRGASPVLRHRAREYNESLWEREWLTPSGG